MSSKVVAERERLLFVGVGSMYCETCGRTERDPIFTDTETCSQCGGYLTALDEEE